MRWGSNKSLYNKNVLTLARNLGREWRKNATQFGRLRRATLVWGNGGRTTKPFMWLNQFS